MAAAMSQQFVTRSKLVTDLRDLGVGDGRVVMVHTRMSALGWVVGGTQTVIEALLEVVGAGGTVLAYAGWEDDPYHLGEWAPERQEAYRRELPPFDPERSAADPDFGRIPERLRTWPGARCSDAHVFRFVAVGRQAEELTVDVPWDFGAGPGSPLARLVGTGGQVLCLGAPLSTLTVLHHAETLVEGPQRRLVAYKVPVRAGDGIEWRSVRDIDTSSRGAFPYEKVVASEDAFAVIGREALIAGAGRSGPVGSSTSPKFTPIIPPRTPWQDHEQPRSACRTTGT
jgi:aminoglycoside 3-N-acetyltransferase